MNYERITSWNDFFSTIKEEDFSKSLHAFLDNEYKNNKCMPPRKDMFKAFELTPLDKVKVVIIGQDPYIGDNQAMGLAFSVPNGEELPPSLVNIYKEIEREFSEPMDYSNGNLEYLARQGVLLLNTILSVRKGVSMSHDIKEYQEFTKRVMLLLDSRDTPMVFMLWGGYAKKFSEYVANPNHIVVSSHHPSPLSANKGGWFGSNNFIQCNSFLVDHHLTPIRWCNKPLTKN